MSELYEKPCDFCKKSLKKFFFITITDTDQDFLKNLCFQCYEKEFGYEFIPSKKSQYDCFFCLKNLFSGDLCSDNKLKYYLIMNMSNGKQIILCEPCFKENSSNFSLKREK